MSKSFTCRVYLNVNVLIFVSTISLFCGCAFGAKNPYPTRCGSRCDGNATACTRESHTLTIAPRVTTGNTSEMCQPSMAHFCAPVDQFAALRMRQPNNITINCTRIGLQLYTAPNGIRYPIPDLVIKGQGWRSGAVYCENAIVDMLILNITMEKGKLTWSSDKTRYVNTGFVTTCDSHGVCLFNADQACVGGPDGNGRNGFCAMCPVEWEAMGAASLDPKFYVTWYGTDSKGNVMMSGGLNPLKFRKYSGANVYDKVRLTGSRFGNIPGFK